MLNYSPDGAARKPHSRQFKPLLFILLSTTFLSACAVQESQLYSQSTDFRVASSFSAFAQSQPHMVDDGWLKSFKSARLEGLVVEALANNRDLRIAAANLVISRAKALQAGAQLLPSVTGSVTGSTENTLSGGGANINGIDIGFNVSWEVDLWGRIRGNRAAAQLDAVSEELLYEYTRQSIASQVVENWIIINGNRQILNIAYAEVSSRKETLANTRARIAEQSALAVDESQASANLELANNRVAAAQGKVEESVRALEVLLGRYPDAKTDVYGSLPYLSASVSAGLPSELLERRPDIIAAERQVAAAFYRRGEAKAAKLPSLKLSASLMGSGGTIGSALTPGNIVWNLVGGIFAPLINSGQLEQDVVIATANQDAALANYGAIALNAFREVEDALSNQKYLGRQLYHLGRAKRELRNSIDSEQERFDAGEIDLFRLADTRIRYYDTQRAAVGVHVAYLLNRVQLHLALGGSFEAAPSLAIVVVAEAN